MFSLQDIMFDTPPSLKCRKLVLSEDGEASLPDGSDSSGAISILQYNILADASIPRGETGLNISGTYSYCPESHRYMDSELAYDCLSLTISNTFL